MATPVNQITQINGPGDVAVLATGVAGGNNCAGVIVSGNPSFTGFVGVFESSPDQVTWTPINSIDLVAGYLPSGPYIAPQNGGQWVFNLTSPADTYLRLRPLAYSSGSLNIGMVAGTLPGGAPVVNQTPTRVTGFASGAAQALTATMPAVAGKTNYVERIIVDGAGATVGNVQVATLTGLAAAATLYYFYITPAGVNTPLDGGKLDLTFSPPLPASGQGVAVSLGVASFGGGNLLATATIIGYAQ